MTSPINLEYATPGPNPAVIRRYFRITCACAFLPMSAGGLVLLLYWIFDLEILPIIGLLLIPIGALTVMIGFIFAGIWSLQLRSHARRAALPVPAKKIGLMFAALLANFGVALFCVAVGVGLVAGPRVVIVVKNDSGAPIESCEISSRWSHGTWAALAPGEELLHAIKVRRATNLRVRIRQGGTTREIIPAFDTDGDSLELLVKPGLEVATTRRSFAD